MYTTQRVRQCKYVIVVFIVIFALWGCKTSFAPEEAIDPMLVCSGSRRWRPAMRASIVSHGILDILRLEGRHELASRRETGGRATRQKLVRGTSRRIGASEALTRLAVQHAQSEYRWQNEPGNCCYLG